MTLTIYQFEGTPSRLDKTNYLTTVGTVNGVTSQGDITILHPTFILNKNQKVIDGNYFYCNETKRYYYYDKNSITELNGGRIAVTAFIDVLNSFKTQIKQDCGLVGVSETEPTAEEQLQEQPTYYFRNDSITKGIDFPNTCFKDNNFSSNVLLIMAP